MLKLIETDSSYFHDEPNIRILNPGSPTDKRRQPHGTVGRLVLADGAVESWTLVEVS